MKILSINALNYGSTGKIVDGIANVCFDQIYYIAYPDQFPNNGKNSNEIVIGKKFFRLVGRRICMFTGFSDCMSVIATAIFLRKVSKINPDIIHLHNLHSSYINIPMLFRYIKKTKTRVVWTLHDCWSFTGQCPHFVMAQCDKWKTGCHDCPQYKLYPRSYVDNTKTMYRLKRKCFTGIKNMTIVTPSQWLGDLVKQSYLKDYPVRVINNGIDLSIFKPSESNFREAHNLLNKHVVLGIAAGWGSRRKGLDVFIELEKRLGDEYKIILVGTDDFLDKQLPISIISIHKTRDQHELAEIYTCADVLANPTREEVFGLVNIEALACGAPVITFRTGGSPETIDGTCGSVVDCDDVDAMEEEIIRVCTEKPYSKHNCIERAKKFDMNNKFKEYRSLYNELFNC